MGVARTYDGNYSQFLESKVAWIEAQYAAWEKQQKEIEQTKDLISRLGAGANSGRASSAEKKLERLQEEDQIEKPFQWKQMMIRFLERGRSGRIVVTIKNLEFSYEDEVLFDRSNLTIERGEKIAIIGPKGCGKSTLLKLIMGLEKPRAGEIVLGDHNGLPNCFEQNQVLFDRSNLTIERGEKIAIIGPKGCGKSTLLKLIMGLEKPRAGEIVLGDHNGLPNCFEQNQVEALGLDKTVLQTVEEVAKDWKIDDIKGLLGCCNFKADMLFGFPFERW